MNSGVKLLLIYDSVYLIALASWVGAILFGVFGALPVARSTLGPERVDAFERELRARACLWGVVSAALALGALVCGVLGVPELRGLGVGIRVIGILASIAGMLYVASGVARARSAAIPDVQSPGPVGQSRRLGNGLLNLSLAVALSLIVAHVYRGTPQSDGLVEDPDALSREYQMRSQGMRQLNQNHWNQYRIEMRRDRTPVSKADSVPKKE